MADPTGLRVRTYQVGFGDCFLLTFSYSRGVRRHVLIDCGSTGGLRGRHSLADVAAHVAESCEGSLTAVVATHRHRDHIGGFSTSGGGDSSGAIFAGCSPRVVMQPWTEDPSLGVDATAPRPRDGRRAFAFDLARLQDSAQCAVELAEHLERVPSPGFASRRLARQLRSLGENNISNRSAVLNLKTMGAASGSEAEYLHAGTTTRLTRLLPGVRVHVLGPPTLDQTDRIRRQRRRDEDEFWHLIGAGFGSGELRGVADSVSGALGTSDLPAFFPQAASRNEAIWARWFVQRMKRIGHSQALEFVRVLDRAMNNTSLILLFEFSGHKALFPGDAQIENWSYALEDPDVLELLSDVTFYKAGHHGSLNATPRTLWNNFERRGRTRGCLKTIISTESGHHGSPEAGTEVPRRTLMRALRDETDCESTEDFGGDELYRDTFLGRRFA